MVRKKKWFTYKIQHTISLLNFERVVAGIKKVDLLLLKYYINILFLIGSVVAEWVHTQILPVAQKIHVLSVKCNTHFFFKV